jgi:hypothetical protein
MDIAMSDLFFSTEQPISVARLSLTEATQQLHRALRSLEQVRQSQEAEDAIRAAEHALQQAELALQDADAMFARETNELQAPALQADYDADAEMSNDLTDLDMRQVAAAEERGEPAPSEPSVAESSLDEPLASLDDQDLDPFEAELERAGEDRPLSESNALRFVGTLAVNVDGDDLGEVQELVLGPQDVVQAVVLNIEGSNGLPERQVRIGWSEIEVSADNRLVVNMSSDDLQQLLRTA